MDDTGGAAGVAPGGGLDLLVSVAAWIAEERPTLVFTGAGVSTDSGIPDFRGPNGVWKRQDPAQWTIQRYLADADVRRARWRDRLGSPVGCAVPNAAHAAIVDLERLGVVEAVVTQNIDGLHQVAGSSSVVELHGTTREAICLECGDRMPVERVLSRVAEGDDDPACDLCGGILKTATISFGQALVEEDLETALSRARRTAVCLAVGSTLSVWPAAGIPVETVRSGGRLVVVNDGPTELDDMAAAVLPGRAGAVLTRLVDAVRTMLADGAQPRPGAAEPRGPGAAPAAVS